MKGVLAMPEHMLSKVTLSDAHSPRECWNPHYHEPPFREDLAEIFRTWHKKQYADNPYFIILRATPLCIFGSHSYSPYVLDEHSDGTYAVCPQCKTVMMCEYNDDTGPGPRACENCKESLNLNCYFQPVFDGSRTREGYLIDPTRDPMVTVTEACALVPGGVPAAQLVAVMAILCDENLLRSGSFVDDFRICYDRLASRLAGMHLASAQSKWAVPNSGALRFNIEITDDGRTMLDARGLLPHSQEAIDRTAELLSMKDEHLQAAAVIVVAKKVLDKK